jgi:hypothetical protein
MIEIVDKLKEWLNSYEKATYSELVAKLYSLIDEKENN